MGKMKMNFTENNTGRLFDMVTRDAPEVQETQETQEKQRKPRKEWMEYTEEERRAFLDNRKTAGRKGAGLPRFNVGFSPQVYDYIRTVSRVRGESMTDFINIVLAEHMEAHRDLYEKAIEFRNSL